MTVAAQLNAICDAQPFVTRFMVRNLLTGEEIGRGENEETPSGSTRKTSIMMAVLKAASEHSSRSSAPRVDADVGVLFGWHFSATLQIERVMPAVYRPISR